MASSDQSFGTSTFSCLKMTLPASSLISAVRRSHSIWSNGFIFASLKTRSMLNNLVAEDPLVFATRAGATLLPRRRTCTRGAAKTSSLMSIMIVLWFVPPVITNEQAHGKNCQNRFKLPDFRNPGPLGRAGQYPITWGNDKLIPPHIVVTRNIFKKL